MSDAHRSKSFSSTVSDQGFLILDGGLATELEARGAVLDDDLWSAAMIVDRPEAIYEVHTAYLDAGADCIVSASYQATIEGFRRYGLSEAEARQRLEDSVTLALRARDDFWGVETNRNRRIKPLVAASVGSYGAYLADGSEFRGDYGLSADELVDFHLPRWEVLADSGADLLACETMPSGAEVTAIRTLLESTPGAQGWISLNCRDESHLADGESLATTVTELDKSSRVVAVGVNCVPPALVSGLVETIRSATDKPIVVYPNSGERWDAVSKSWLEEGDQDPFAEAPRWFEHGARIFGGCCRTGPEDITRLRKKIVGLAPQVSESA